MTRLCLLFGLLAALVAPLGGCVLIPLASTELDVEVRSDDADEPIAGAEVTVSHSPATPLHILLVPRRSFTSDADGAARLRIDHLSGVATSVAVTAPGYESAGAIVHENPKREPPFTLVGGRRARDRYSPPAYIKDKVTVEGSVFTFHLRTDRANVPDE